MYNVQLDSRFSDETRTVESGVKREISDDVFCAMASRQGNLSLPWRFGVRKRRAFTMIELVVVIAIIAILAALAIPAYSVYIEKSKQKRCIAEIKGIEMAIAAFENERAALPDTLAEVGFGTTLDPWGSLYQYLRIEGSGMSGKGSLRKDRHMNPLNSDYDLYSMGKDRDSKLPLMNPASKDDIIRANNGAYVGLAENF